MNFKQNTFSFVCFYNNALQTFFSSAWKQIFYFLWGQILLSETAFNIKRGNPCIFQFHNAWWDKSKFTFSIESQLITTTTFFSSYCIYNCTSKVIQLYHSIISNLSESERWILNVFVFMHEKYAECKLSHISHLEICSIWCMGLKCVESALKSLLNVTEVIKLVCGFEARYCKVWVFCENSWTEKTEWR